MMKLLWCRVELCEAVHAAYTCVSEAAHRPTCVETCACEQRSAAQSYSNAIVVCRSMEDGRKPAARKGFLPVEDRYGVGVPLRFVPSSSQSQAMDASGRLFAWGLDRFCSGHETRHKQGWHCIQAHCLPVYTAKQITLRCDLAVSFTLSGADAKPHA